MRRLAVAAAIAMVVLLAVPTANAHAPGSPPITANGSFVLGKVSGNNSSYHAYIAALGIPPGPGDTLKFSWSANSGIGPAIAFNIHSHPANSTNNSMAYATTYYNAVADRVDDQWVVAGTGPYMVFWDNPNDVKESVSYSFVLLPPSPDLTVFVVFPVILAVVVLLLWVARRRPHRPSSKSNGKSGL
jgi:hypothetical protein